MLVDNDRQIYKFECYKWMIWWYLHFRTLPYDWRMGEMFHWIGLREKQLPERPEELIVTAWFPIFSDLQIFTVSICIHPVNVEVLF